MIPETLREANDTVPTPVPLLEAQCLSPGEQERGIDLVLLVAVLALLALGTVEIYSASAVLAARRGHGTAVLERQLIYVGLGLGVLWLGAAHDYRWLRRRAYPLLWLAILLLSAVLLFGSTVLGAKRWFLLGPLSFQPVEVAKIALVAWMASSLAQKQEKVKSLLIGFLPIMLVCGAMVLLLLAQPDLGSCLILGGTTLALLFVAGAKISYILIAVMSAAPVLYWAIVGTPWRLERMKAFLDPWQYKEGVGYQITESLMGIGSGGWTGLGLGDGKQKLGYMPEPFTDFIMSSVGEELGFVGFATVLLLFGVIVWRGARAALRARDAFGAFLAFGLTTILALQALVNTGVVLGALPAKGLTLPFVSYGGSSLMVSMYCAGLLLAVSRADPAPVAQEHVENARLRNARRARRPGRVRVVRSIEEALRARG